MPEDRKYPIQGTVTISAEEYRDLILTAEQNKNSADKNMHRAWEAESKLSAAEKRIAELAKELEEQAKIHKQYAAFIAADTDIAAKYYRYSQEEQNAANTPKEV